MGLNHLWGQLNEGKQRTAKKIRLFKRDQETLWKRSEALGKQPDNGRSKNVDKKTKLKIEIERVKKSDSSRIPTSHFKNSSVGAQLVLQAKGGTTN